MKKNYFHKLKFFLFNIFQTDSLSSYWNSIRFKTLTTANAIIMFIFRFTRNSVSILSSMVTSTLNMSILVNIVFLWLNVYTRNSLLCFRALRRRHKNGCKLFNWNSIVHICTKVEQVSHLKHINSICKWNIMILFSWKI